MTLSKMIARPLVAAVLGLTLCGMSWGEALAQAQPVTTHPSVANSGEGSGSIVTSNVFQLVFAAPSGAQSRRGCLVLNNQATDREWVYFQGPGMTVPTAANSASLEADAVPLEHAPAANGLGGWVTCATNGGSVLQDAIWIAGTSGDTFVAKQQ